MGNKKYYLVNPQTWSAGSIFGVDMTEDEVKRKNERHITENIVSRWMSQEEIDNRLGITGQEDMRRCRLNHHLYSVCKNCGMVG